MIIYNPQDAPLRKERISAATALLEQIPSKHCFITGSFLYRAKYRDIDIFVVSRTKKRLAVKEQRANITMIDFNALHSLFYHSIAKSCIAKGILPSRPLKVTLADYWEVIAAAVPMLLNQKNAYRKEVRFLILYTEYFRTGKVLDSFQLDQKIRSFGNYRDILSYIGENTPKIMLRNGTRSYLMRFFYTQAGTYRDLRGYAAQDFLYNLAHQVTRVLAHG